MKLDGVDKNWDVLQAVFSTDSVDKDYYTLSLEDEEEDQWKLHQSRPKEGVSSRSIETKDKELPKPQSRPKQADAGANPSSLSAETKELVDRWRELQVKHTAGTIELVGPDRAREISVALQSFRRTTQNALAEAIDCLEPVYGDRVFTLNALLPTDEERRLVQGYCGRDTDLAPASRWLQRITSVPECDTKVRVMQIMETFLGRADRLSEKFQTVERASGQILDSPKLKKLLNFVLRVGSVLVEAGEVGDQAAKAVEPMADDDQEDGRMTVFEFVVQSTVSRSSRSLNLMSDLPDCEAASQIHIPELLHELSDLFKALDTCHKELYEMRLDEVATTHWFETAVSLHQGTARLERFVSEATIRFSTLELERDLALSSCREVAHFCGVKNSPNSTACLALLTKFAQDLDRASRKYLEKKYAARRRSMEGNKQKEGTQAFLVFSRFPAPGYQEIDKRHLRHVHSMVEMYDELLGHDDADPAAKKARNLFVTVIAVGPKREEEWTTVEEIPRGRVKALIEFYNKLLGEHHEEPEVKKEERQEEQRKEEPVAKEEDRQEAPHKEEPAVEDSVVSPSDEQEQARGVDVNNRESSPPEDASSKPIQLSVVDLERTIDRSHVHHVHSVVGADGQLLIRQNEPRELFGCSVQRELHSSGCSTCSTCGPTEVGAEDAIRDDSSPPKDVSVSLKSIQLPAELNSEHRELLVSDDIVSPSSAREIGAEDAIRDDSSPLRDASASLESLQLPDLEAEQNIDTSHLRPVKMFVGAEAELLFSKNVPRKSELGSEQQLPSNDIVSPSSAPVTGADDGHRDGSSPPKDASDDLKSLQLPDLEKDHMVDTRHLRHVKSLVGTEAELLVSKNFLVPTTTEVSSEQRGVHLSDGIVGPHSASTVMRTTKDKSPNDSSAPKYALARSVPLADDLDMDQNIIDTSHLRPVRSVVGASGELLIGKNKGPSEADNVGGEEQCEFHRSFDDDIASGCMTPPELTDRMWCPCCFEPNPHAHSLADYFAGICAPSSNLSTW